MKQKFISGLLAFCIVCSLLTANVSAAQTLSGKHGTDFTSGELATRLESIFYNGISGCVTPSLPAVGNSFSKSQQYTTTFANQGGSKADWTCQAYARAAYSYLFGYDMADGSYRDEFTSAKGKDSLSYEDFTQYNVRCGAYLRTTNLSDGSYSNKDGVVIGHSMIILGYDSVGITTLEGNYDNKGGIAICNFTWSQFNQERMNKRYVCSLSQPTEEIYAALGGGFISTSSPYFVCNIRINCINGQTVNLYNNPGDTSRADYFSLGQTVSSTCGMVRSDGSTWYRITANQSGTPKTFWLKYESGKMTVTNLMSKGPYTLTPKCAPGTRLDVKGSSAENGANVQIYTSNGTAAQQWELTYLGNGYYTIISKASGKALDVAGASTESGTNVQQYTPNGTNAQQWMLKDAGEGYYYIVPRVNTGLCLDVTGAGTADKTNVEIYTANGTDAQKWKLTAPEISYTVTFNPNGGSISQSSKTVTTGQKYGDLPMPSRSGYIFDGWYTSANGGTQVTAATTVNLTGNQTLYAQWKINCFNHTYDADTCTNCGARLPYDNGFDASAAGTYQVSENTAYIRTGPYQVKDLVRTMSRGETLRVIGSVINSYNNIWMKTADGYYVHADKLTLYSETQAQSYYVILDDGSVCSRITVTNGETYGNLPTPAKEGYTFDGWYTSARGGTHVTAATTVNLTGNQTLYAHWTKNPITYTVTFDPNGGSVSTSSKQVTDGSHYGTLPTPTREGYTFDDWYTSADGGIRMTSNTIANLTSDQTLYAHWTKEEPVICSHVKGRLQYSDTSHPHYNHYTCSKCGESFTDYSTTPDRSCDSCWGPWSSWSNTPVSSSSTREVETKQVMVSDSCTEYRYGRYVDGTGRNAGWCTTYLTKLGFSGMTVQYSDWTTFRYPAKEKDWTCGVCGGPHTGVHHYSTDGRAWWKEYVSPQSGNFFWEESRQTDAVYETQYRYRDLITP